MSIKFSCVTLRHMSFAVGNVAVLNDPPPAPMRADHAVLERRRGGPGRGRLGHGKAADRDVVHARLGGEEALAPDAHFHLFFIGVHTLEIGVEDGLVPLRILLGIPLVPGGLRLPAAGVDLALQALLQAGGLIQGLVVEVDAACMLVRAGKIPVAIDEGDVYKRQPLWWCCLYPVFRLSPRWDR